MSQNVDMDADENRTQLHVRFVTKQKQYAIADTPYALSSDVCTKELSTLVNGVLQETSPDVGKQVNFDFIVCGEFLRGALGEHLKTHAASTESTLEVEYLERLPAPKPHDCLTHDDWVSAVSCRSSWIVTGCYDNSLHIWSTKGEHKLAIPGHTSPVKTVTWVHLDSTTGIFISGSHDQTAMIWEWDIEANSAECMVACHGHDKSVDCIDVTPDRSLFVTGSWDTNIKLWNANLREEDESTSKKSKSDHGKPRGAKLTLKGHRENVSGAKFLGCNEALASASWDHTVKIWDVELEAPSRTIASNKAFFCLDWEPSSNMLLTSAADRNIRIFDNRSNIDAPAVTIRGHTSWISAVKWSRDQETLFLSAGHDMTLKMWDVRSPRAPLYDLTGHTDKLLCCDWTGRYMLSGGADNALRIYKSRKQN